MASPPRPPRRPLRVEDFAVRRRNNSRRAMNVDNDVLVQSFLELNQAGIPAPAGQLPAWYLAKVNQGQVQIPVDKRQNAINLTDIDADEEVVRIRQLGQDFFYRKDNWEQWMRTQLAQYPNRPVVNPANRVPVTPDQITLYTAQVLLGGKRSGKSRRTRRSRYQLGGNNNNENPQPINPENPIVGNNENSEEENTDWIAIVIYSAQGNVDKVRELAAKPDINVNGFISLFRQNDTHYNALMAATLYGHLDIVKILLAVPGIKVNAKYPGDTITAVKIAIILKRTDILRRLLEVPGINLRGTHSTARLIEEPFRSQYATLLEEAGAGDRNAEESRNDVPDWWNEKQKAFDAHNRFADYPEVNIPADNRLNVIEQEDIEDGDIIVRIQQDGHDFFYKENSWEKYMEDLFRREKPIINPVNRMPVTPDQIDIFLARIPSGGSRRKSRRARRHTRRATRRR